MPDSYNDARGRRANDAPENPAGRYVLYWMQATRRLADNHALDHALRWCKALKKPLVVYEGLRLDYPWASARHHALALYGMRDNAAAARRLGVSYWPFVETPDQPARGLVRRLAADACLVVTDDHPGFVVPAHIRAVSRAGVAVHAVDTNSVVPLGRLGPAVSAAAHLRPRIHKQFADAWAHRAAAEPAVPPAARADLPPPFRPWDVGQDVDAAVKSLPVDQSVAPVPDLVGGPAAGRAALAAFVRDKLPHYADGRNQPDDPARNAASRLSPYLRWGHLGIGEVTAAVLDSVGWAPADLRPKGGRDDFFSRDPNVNAFLDEAITWRDVGYQWHFARGQRPEAGSQKDAGSPGASGTPQFNFATFDFTPGGDMLELVLPEWAKATLRKHAADPRQHVYSLEEFEAAATHDPLWNAAQRELVATGRIHNYLRMLWGKKVLEWSATPADAYRVLEHLNNKYAVDGRDPNSYTGILWCFGLFDRPWAPERPVYGTVRFMSSDATAKKFKLDGYYRYVRRVAG